MSIGIRLAENTRQNASRLAEVQRAFFAVSRSRCRMVN
jgi:hypothetical protein